MAEPSEAHYHHYHEHLESESEGSRMVWVVLTVILVAAILLLGFRYIGRNTTPTTDNSTNINVPNPVPTNGAGETTP